MNFLGHCYLCIGNEHLISGNLAGDSYKGNLDKISHLPKYILNGVKFHRFIDDYTDQSNQIKEVAHIFQSNGISKVTYIACDILIDHYLSKNWTRYSAIKYDQFILTVYNAVEKDLSKLELDFQLMFSKIKEHQLFFEYPEEKGIEKVLLQFSKRIPFKNDLAKCMNIYLANKNTIEPLFKSFLSQIKTESEKFILDHTLNVL